LRHDLAQEGETIHARHLDVEDDDVGKLDLEATGRGIGVRRRAHHRNFGISSEDRAQRLADGG
jgi:hypothetical protein